MTSKPLFLCTVIFVIPLFLWSTGFDCYNDMAEADFVSHGQKFENVDVENFAAEKSCFTSALIFTCVFHLPESRLFLAYDPSLSSLLPFSTRIETLRC